MKKIISLILAFVLVLSTLIFSTVSVGAVEKLDTPSIISTESGVGGDVVIKWNPVPNAVKYQVLHKTSSGVWKKMGDTTDTTFIGKGAKSGATYTYSVRCISEDGKTFTSDYNSKGWSHKYVDTPVISKLTPELNKIDIKWNAVAGASMYRVFYRSGNNWVKLVDTKSTSCKGNNPKTNSVYTYTVRAVSADGKKFESGINDGKSIVYKASVVNLKVKVGGLINLNDVVKTHKDAPIYGKKIPIGNWVVSNSNIYHKTGSKYLIGMNENSSGIVTVTATDGSKMFLSVRVMSFNEAIVGVYCRLSGRNKNAPADSARTELPIYTNKTGESTVVTLSEGEYKEAQILEYYSSSAGPTKSRFRVKYKQGKKEVTGWVTENYVLINAYGLTPSYDVSLSFATNKSYPNHKSKTKYNGLYNMFNFNGSYISGMSDKSYYNYHNTAWLRFDFAKKLAKEQARFLRDGYKLKIYDAYRPYAVTRKIKSVWTDYIVNKNASGGQIAGISIHNCGAAVDVSLVNLETGVELDMPTTMHDLSNNSSHGVWQQSSGKAVDNARYLYRAMTTYGGFGVYKGEWWHFQDDNFQTGTANKNRVYYCIDN